MDCRLLYVFSIPSAKWFRRLYMWQFSLPRNYFGQFFTDNNAALMNGQMKNAV